MNDHFPLYLYFTSNLATAVLQLLLLFFALQRFRYKRLLRKVTVNG